MNQPVQLSLKNVRKSFRSKSGLVEVLGNLRSLPVYGDFVAQKYIRQALAAK